MHGEITIFKFQIPVSTMFEFTFLFTPDALPGTTFPIYPGLGQALNMLACIPGGLYETNCIKISSAV